jgi:hypothetical protein
MKQNLFGSFLQKILERVYPDFPVIGHKHMNNTRMVGILRKLFCASSLHYAYHSGCHRRPPIQTLARIVRFPYSVFEGSQGVF